MRTLPSEANADSLTPSPPGAKIAPMRRLIRWLWITIALLLVATAAAAALPHFAFELQAPHAARRSAAALDPALDRAIEAGLDKSKPNTVEEARDFALSVTDKLLRFGLGHKTSLSFSLGEREANCIEYAELFARVFERAAAAARLPAKVYVVHSGKARLFGQKVPMRGWDDHDWVILEDRTSGEAERLFIDPTLHDAGLGWDIASNVKGTVKLPP
jgi:hypothetical protein